MSEIVAINPIKELSKMVDKQASSPGSEAPSIPRAPKRSGVRLGIEALGVVIACAMAVLAFNQGALSERATNRDDLVATLSVTESVSRYISQMGGYGSVDNGRIILDYRSISHEHNRSIPSLKLGNADALPGALRINSSMVSTLRGLIEEFQGDDSKRLLRQIVGPIKHLGESADPTLVGAGLAILAGTQSIHTERNFENSFLQYMLIKNLELTEFRLNNADFRSALISYSSFSACMVNKARFEGATIQDAIFELGSCAGDRYLNLSSVALDGNTFGIKLLRNDADGEKNGLWRVNLSGATNKSNSAALECSGDNDATINLQLSLDESSNLKNSRFENCSFDNLVVPSGASFGGSQFKMGAASGAHFGKDSLQDAQFENFNLTQSDLHMAGLHLSADSNALKGVTLDDAVLPYIEAYAEEGSSSGNSYTPAESVPERLKNWIKNHDIRISEQRAVWFSREDGTMAGGLAALGGGLQWVEPGSTSADHLKRCSIRATDAKLLGHPCAKWHRGPQNPL